MKVCGYCLAGGLLSFMVGVAVVWGGLVYGPEALLEHW